MKKSITIIVMLLVIPIIGVAQDTVWDQLKHELSVANHDTSRVLALTEVISYYKLNRPDSAFIYGYRALALARKIKFPKGELAALHNLIITQLNLGNDSKALQMCLQANKIAEQNNMSYYKALIMVERGKIYSQSRDYVKAISLFKDAKMIFDSVNALAFSVFAQNKIGETYLAMNQLDSALYYSQLAYDKVIQTETEYNWASSYVLLNLGKIQHKSGNTNTALLYFRQSLLKAGLEAELVFNSYFSIAQLYQQIGKPDSSILYAKKSLAIAQASGFYKHIIEASLLLANIYGREDTQQALQYSQKAIAYKDSLDNLVKSTTQESFTDFDEQERQREIELTKIEFQNRLRVNTFLGIAFTLLVIAIFLFWNNRLKQKAKRNIEKAYDQLRSTQAQLIQSEKMASLGELTAGIAHEIQNPLNFVNNFSEVSSELIVEMNEELHKGDIAEAKIIASDIQQNLEKINHHGKRADAIVKGMLLHSQTSTGQKEPTDINKLADEYLRLAYHGLRGKNNSFNATMKTDFDETIGKINIIPQDIGRVLLNLYNNAFYAVTEKKKLLGESYEPVVSVSTKKLSNKIEISVRDNGSGIPQNVIDKIFQPFFTTKPTGQGTGLGLSLSYDIVKAHGGELKVETKESEGVEFIIQLPIS